MLPEHHVLPARGAGRPSHAQGIFFSFFDERTKPTSDVIAPVSRKIDPHAFSMPKVLL